MATSGTSNQHSSTYPTTSTNTAGQANVWVTSNSVDKTYTVYITASMGTYRNSGSGWTGTTGCGSGTANVYIDGVMVGNFDTYFNANAYFAPWEYNWTRPNIGTWSKTFNYDSAGHGRDITAYIDFPVSVTGGTLSMPSPMVTVHPDDIVVVTAPAVPSVSVSSVSANSVTFNVTCSSYGNPSNAPSRYIEAAVSNVPNYYATGGERRYRSASATLSAAITVGNSSSGSLNIVSNTQYYYGAYASNTMASSETPGSSMQNNRVTTAPSAPTTSNFTVVDAGSASFNITDASSGTASAIQLKYRYKPADGSFTSWTNAGNTGTHQTRTVNLTGLDSNTAYTVEVKAVAANSLESTVAVYENAFTTEKVTTTITSQTDASSHTYDKIDRTFAVSFSAVSGTGTSYQYRYQYKKSNSADWGTEAVATSSSPSTTFVVMLDPSTTYDFRIQARIAGGVDEEYGDYAISQFTTASYSPGDPKVSARFNDDRSHIYIDVTPSGIVTSVTCTVKAKKPGVANNITVIDNVTKSTTGSVVTFDADLDWRINPEDYSNISIEVVQRYMSTSTTAYSNISSPWRVLGVITMANGVQEKIVKIVKKLKDGTFVPHYAEHPFITK